MYTLTPVMVEIERICLLSLTNLTTRVTLSARARAFHATRAKRHAAAFGRCGEKNSGTRRYEKISRRLVVPAGQQGQQRAPRQGKADENALLRRLRPL